MSNTLGTKRLGTVLALIVAFAIALAMIVTPAAHAAGDATPAVTLGNIQSGDSAPAYKLTIHKHDSKATGNDAIGKPGDGSKLDPAPSKGLEGAKFKIWKVKKTKVDLTEQAAWETVKDLKPAQILESERDSIGEVTTDQDGVASKDLDKEPALYYVEETKTPAGHSTKIDPFLVVVPLPSSNKAAVNGWLYDVHVYPKNVEDGQVTKVVGANADTHVKGDKVEWDMKLPIPEVKKDFKNFVLRDALDNHLTEDADDSSLAIYNGDTKVVDLVRDTDYSAEMKNLALDAKGFYLTIIFKESGLTKLNANKGKDIKWVLSTTVSADAPDSIYNQKPSRNWYFDGQPGVPPTTDTPPGDVPPTTNTPPTPPTDIPGVFFGNYKFTKVDSAVATNVLSGAKFDVYLADKTTKVLSDVTSDANGVVKFEGLYIGSTSDKPLNAKTFYFKETQAPVGYTLDDSWKSFELTANKTAEANTGKVVTTGDNVTNTKAEVPNLPLTGASGKLLMTLGGAAIVLFAAGTVLVTRRRKA